MSLWRRAYDLGERTVAPHLDAMVRSAEFARIAALAMETQNFARRRLDQGTATLWHLMNLPAATDVARLRASIGALDREVRQLTARLEHENQEAPDATTPAPERPAGSAAARRRPRHPARP